jgi:hypothetical protein
VTGRARLFRRDGAGPGAVAGAGGSEGDSHGPVAIEDAGDVSHLLTMTAVFDGGVRPRRGPTTS